MKIQNLLCLHVLLQKSSSTELTLSQIMPPKYQIIRSHINFWVTIVKDHVVWNCFQ